MTAGLILAGGEGSRLRALGIPKPLVDVGGEPLVVRAARALEGLGCAPVVCLVRAPWGDEVSGRLRAAGSRARVVVCETPSSLHTLALGLDASPGAVLATMVDTVMAPSAWRVFHAVASRALDGGADVVLGITRLCDDENPLRVARGADGAIVAIGGGASGSPWITAGVYAFSSAIAGRAREALDGGVVRMRGFLEWALESGSRFAAVELPDVADVDRPEDVPVAARLLGEGEVLG